MGYTYIRRELSLEELAAQVISLAAQFSEVCAWHAQVPKSPWRRVFPHMLERLAYGNVVDDRDTECIAEIGRGFVTAANARLPGYGDHVLNCPHYVEEPIDDGLALLKSHIELHHLFQSLRSQLIARMRARELIGCSE
ncbi:hypothetical protein [Shimia sp.]|uniref:hypothetical protein n=1 Tax=Shimia sp. TaxID=1954381 RepID=UPI00329750C3